MCCVHPWRKTCLQTLQTRRRPAREREWPVQSELVLENEESTYVLESLFHMHLHMHIYIYIMHVCTHPTTTVCIYYQ
jgi:hypothetical protein